MATQDSEGRQTYSSTGRTFKLDESHLFEVVGELFEYALGQSTNLERARPKEAPIVLPALTVYGKGKALAFQADRLNERDRIEACELAALGYGDDGNLYLEILENSRLLVDPSGLESIGRKYLK